MAIPLDKRNEKQVEKIKKEDENMRKLVVQRKKLRIRQKLEADLKKQQQNQEQKQTKKLFQTNSKVTTDSNGRILRIKTLGLKELIEPGYAVKIKKQKKKKDPKLQQKWPITYRTKNWLETISDNFQGKQRLQEVPFDPPAMLEASQGVEVILKSAR